MSCFNKIDRLEHYLTTIEADNDSVILFTNCMESIRVLECDSATESGKVNYYVIMDCGREGHKADSECSICDIMDYADIDRLPAILYFRKRVLKGEVIGFKQNELVSNDKGVHPKIQASICRAQQRRPLGNCLNNTIFHIMNIITLGSVCAALTNLWHAQGINVTIRRTIRHPRKSWERWFELKKEEWRAIGIMSALMITAAAGLPTLLAMSNHSTPQLLCLASIICNLGSAISTTTLLSCFESVHAVRLAWFEGGARFVLALSAPSAWLRWGIVTLLAALLDFVWASRPITAKILGTLLIAIQFSLFFVLPFIGQTYRFWGAVQLFNIARPLNPDGTQDPNNTTQLEAESLRSSESKLTPEKLDYQLGSTDVV